MKKIILITFIISIIFLFSVPCNAEVTDEFKGDIESLMNSLSDEAKEDLESLSVDDTDLSQLNNIKSESVINLILKKIRENAVSPFTSCSCVIAIILIYSMLDSYKSSLRQTSMQEVMSLVSTLCITAVLIVPVISLIDYSIATIREASDFMILYVPIMIGILAFSGKTISSAGYYTMILSSCQIVSQLSSKFIAPLLNVFLGFSVSSSITDKVNLQGFCDMFSKIIKWLIAFIMTVFSAMLTIRSMITTAYDSVTARAVRFTLSSFIPIVGTAISEAYKTIQGSVNLLRSGVGVFVILAILIVFLPSVIRCLLWLMSINLCKAIAQTVGVTTPCNLLSSVSSVISTIFAIIICISSVFVISTAILITVGGSNG